MNSEDKKYLKGCDGKRKFRTKKNAQDELKKIRKTGVIVQNANVYHCQYCNGWHTGHNRKENK